VTELQALILGIVQGLTEFLPISSSGHLKLTQYLLGSSFADMQRVILFDLVCHMGTLLAILLVLRKDLVHAMRTEQKRFVLTALLPLIPLYFMMEPLREAYTRPYYLGYSFLFTSLLLFASERLGGSRKTLPSSKRDYCDAFLVGISQTIALLPGVSRSGSTICTGRLLGWSRATAIRFSFLLAIPTILGGAAAELLALFKVEAMPEVSLSCYMIGFLSSSIIGYFSLSWLVKKASKGSFLFFAWYCLLLGFACIFFMKNSMPPM
jgi:undecaprenyl-diphosphatase